MGRSDHTERMVNAVRTSAIDHAETFCYTFKYCRGDDPNFQRSMSSQWFVCQIENVLVFVSLFFVSLDDSELRLPTRVSYTSSLGL